MCGIAGKISFKKPIIESELRRLSLAVAHRGPDDQGIFISPDKRVGLVHRRLAIIDLTPAGHQPMSYLDRYWITYNGEVYNHDELRNRLQKLDYRFQSRSDTEVILAMYDKYQEKSLNYLRGMFAFAIYDRKRQVVFLARDRTGKKPLKYFFNGQEFIFASELKAILTQKEIVAQPDNEDIYSYLNWGYVPAPKTGFKNIFKLEPGNYLLLNLSTGNLSKHCYWDDIDYSHKLRLSETEWSEKILDLLEQATKLRMISDVPIGAFLSGGLDSSSVVAMMAKNSKQPIKTFTIGFSNDRWDETKYAKQVSDLFKTDHVVLEAHPQSIEILPEIARIYEEPFGDSSALVAYMVSQLARKHVKVILNGDGGDENFAGYNHHLKLQRDYLLYPIAKFIPFGKYPNSMRGGILEKYITYKSIFSYPQSHHLYHRAFLDSHSKDIRDQAMYADFKHYLNNDLNVKMDIASMNSGLECRSPYLDHKLVELAAQIPFSLKVKNGQTKYILKKALTKILPSNIVYRPKMGFSIPLSAWFTKELNTYARSVLITRHTRVNDFFPTTEISKMLSQHSETNDLGPKLWHLLMLELWFKNYFS